MGHDHGLAEQPVRRLAVDTDILQEMIVAPGDDLAERIASRLASATVLPETPDKQKAFEDERAGMR
jgi:hypothetical protein